MGRSRGGLTSKIHMLCDELGMPLYFTITAGQESDYKEAIGLIAKGKNANIIADRGYDSDAIVEYIQSRGKVAIIPSRANRVMHRTIDLQIYKMRNRIERLFGRLKQHRRLATRFEKSVTNYSSMVFIACALIWLIQM